MDMDVRVSGKEERINVRSVRAGGVRGVGSRGDWETGLVGLWGWWCPVVRKGARDMVPGAWWWW